VIYLAARARSLSRAAERAAVSSVLFINDPRPRISPRAGPPQPALTFRRGGGGGGGGSASGSRIAAKLATPRRPSRAERDARISRDHSVVLARGPRGGRAGCGALRCGARDARMSVLSSPRLRTFRVADTLVHRERARLSGDTYRSRQRRSPLSRRMRPLSQLWGQDECARRRDLSEGACVYSLVR